MKRADTASDHYDFPVFEMNFHGTCDGAGIAYSSTSPIA